MADILNITGESIFDDRIIKIEITCTIRTSILPLGIATRYEYLQQQDLYTLSC